MPFFNLNELSEKERKKYLQDLDNTAYNNSLQVREEEQKILNENILTDEENGKNIHEKTNLFMIAC